MIYNLRNAYHKSRQHCLDWEISTSSPLTLIPMPKWKENKKQKTSVVITAPTLKRQFTILPEKNIFQTGYQ